MIDPARIGAVAVLIANMATLVAMLTIVSSALTDVDARIFRLVERVTVLECNVNIRADCELGK